MGMLRRRWRRGRRWLTQHLEAWHDARFERAEWRRIHAQEEKERLMALNALEAAQTRALLSQLDQHTIAAIKSILREEVLPELRGEALEIARGELAEELAKAKEQLDDQAAAYREQVDAEVESRVEADVRRATEELKADFEDTLQDLRTQRTQARQQRDAAEQQLLSLLRQLLGDTGRYLRSAHVEEFDQFAVNAILKRYGWRVRSKATFSERTVKTKLGEARWQARSVFWLDVTPVEEVEDPEADESASEDSPGPLALPPGEGG